MQASQLILHDVGMELAGGVASQIASQHIDKGSAQSPQSPVTSSSSGFPEGSYFRHLPPLIYSLE